jgi:hypothetical protein
VRQADREFLKGLLEVLDSLKIREREPQMDFELELKKGLRQHCQSLVLVVHA